MATIMFGTISAVLPGNKVTAGEVTGKMCKTEHIVSVQPSQMAKTEPSVRSGFHFYRHQGKMAVKAYDDAMKKMDEALRNNDALQRRLKIYQYSPLQMRKGGGGRMRIATEEQAEKRRAKAIAAEKAHQEFLSGGFSNDVHIGKVDILDLTQKGEQVSFKSPFWKRAVKTKRTKQVRTMVKGDANGITNDLMRILAKSGKQFEIINGRQRAIKGRFMKFRDNILPKIELPHERGIYKRQELNYESIQKDLTLLCTHGKYRSVENNDIVSGFSGVCFDERSSITTENTQLPHFVVRGRKDGSLVNALDTFDDVEFIHHYSHQNEIKFFQGWRDAFNEMIPHIEDHECTIDYDNEECGAFAATMSQSLFPVKKLSCGKCRQHLTGMSWEEFKQYLITHMGCCDRVWQKKRTVSEYKVVEKFVKQVTYENMNIEVAMEIVRLTQGHTSTPMLQIQDINKALSKGPAVTQTELDTALKQLLAMTQWWRNHMTLTGEDSLKTFRNKRSAKAMINPSLLCDNQLDKNGNFIWGERGYHSKRFFSSFFDEVIPSEGYTKHVIRKNPNGQRELAIGSLIVPMSLSRARTALQGRSVRREPLTLACTSKLGTNFVYPCCCVTQDDGTPFYSDLKSPTKRHLVVGTSGEPKYIDLPATDAEKMYIAKEGYCYLNIFLAMLVNVNESEAKDFTKMVRDTIIPLLGTWPTMLDLATAVYMLTIFHPEVRNAELPRIYDDHASQTMHVIDSFGSLTTGYHVLKAGTVNQLISFASDDLQGEMKFYRVGGEVQQRMKCETTLIKSIFKPKLMMEILKEDPYLLIMGMISPTILVHMYRMRHLEKGIEFWINRDQEVAKIFVVLEQLTTKVAMNDVLLTQLQIINETSSQVLTTLDNCQNRTHGFKPARDLLTMCAENNDSNKVLHGNGFLDLNDQLYSAREKIYADRLKKEWYALNLLERYCATWQLKKFSICTERSLTKIAVDGKTQSSVRFVDVCFTKATTYFRSTKDFFVRRIESVSLHVGRKIVNFFLGIIHRCYSDLIYLVNVCIIFSLLVQMMSIVRSSVAASRQEKETLQRFKMKEDEGTVIRMYDLFARTCKGEPVLGEFREHVKEVRPDLLHTLEYMSGKEEVELQAKTQVQLQFEKIIAVLALITMCIDAERSDAIFRILSKLKMIFSTVGEDVKVQSLDDIENISDDKLLTVDFDLDTNKPATSVSFDVKFEDWWNRQLQQNRVVPHYRTSGDFMEFTRETAAQVANAIKTSSSTEFLIRGAVGSGKSTGLPHHLSKEGKVLLLEPTRPLAENVSKQLGKDPFYHHVTLRMRGLSVFGSSNITVMTSGFAFHYYVNNPGQLAEFDFIMIDECHVLDSSTIAFNCALKEFEFAGKLIKVSATPPGRECEFTTQHPVKLKVEEHLSFQNFVQAQGSKSNADMVQHGNNLLVYVASYNEVDTLAKYLTEKQYKVTKVDGRTMQMGNVEIVTSGTAEKPHFVVATNIIENGVTLDIDCVIDFGLKVVAELDTDNRCVRYSKRPVTYGERIQRLGRVGRCKPGFALRIGHTEKGMEEIPEFIATEAAFLSFAYGLPVTTQNVTTNIPSNCTVKQARNALNFEITPFVTTHFIKYDGSMHPEIHKLLKPYKLRESEMLLSKLAIPFQYTNQWITVKDYDRRGIRLHCHEGTRIPFFVNGIPDKLYEMLWETVCKYKSDAGFGRISSVNATKISYTLSTDPSAIPRTIAIIDHLLSEEMMKKNHFDTIGSTITGYSFSLAGIAEGFRNRYLRDYTGQNIATLQQARARLLEFDSRRVDLNNLHSLDGLGVLNTVRLQSKSEIVKFLGLKGKWDGKKFMNDIIVGLVTLIGGGWLMWEYFTKSAKEPVSTQGKKRQVQKLKFRDAFDRKVGRVAYADDNTLEHTFGEAYTKRGKVKGSTHTKGMGRKTRNFTHLYGVEPDNYNFIRFVDPLTGHTMDESTRVDIRIVQDEFGEVRREKIDNDELDPHAIVSRPGLQAYFIGKNTENALRVDLTPHIPTLLCQNSNAIAGYPEREDELRQTGAPIPVPIADVPKRNEHVELESKSIYKGLRDYNGISTLVCQLTNSSDGHNESVYGIGYGPYVITNGHLFRRNNGILKIKTWHGEFTIMNSTQVRIHFIEGRDVILIRMPKDFPPFARKNLFRGPIKEEKVCMVGTNFQDKSLRATISESSIILPEGKSSFWMHWISTKDGECGIPMVSTNDGAIVGIHGLTSNESEKNFFVPFEDQFEEKYLKNAEALTWDKHWLWQPEKIVWGSLNLVTEQPREEFKVSKFVEDLWGAVSTQSKRDRWVFEEADGNLRACCTMESSLVTKHVVKGKCPYFEEYLRTHEAEREFFTPLMGAYKPSRLNKDAFKKDFFKYNKPIVLNEVDFDSFTLAVDSVKLMVLEFGFHECTYITDTDTIFESLNMKAAVGAQYRGKKKDFLDGMDMFEKDRLLYLSCERLFYGEKGVWNGSLKAELRPKEKVEMNKTRTFTAAPIDTLLGAKVCVDDFNNQFYSLNLTCPWTVGMTKFYGGWDKLMKSLPDHWIYCHADGSQFDSSLTPLLLNSVLDIRKFFMQEWWVGEEMLENLYAEIVYTPILTPDGTIFKKFRGNNSGQPSTVVDNTLMVVVSVYYSCIKLGWSEEDIQNNLVFFANGDDVILAVQPKFEYLYDSMGKSFMELGLNYDFSERTTKREDLWFMSHQAKEIGGMYIPKLEMERIVSILEWDRSKELMHRTEAICAAMIEAWGHTELLREIRKFYMWLIQKEEFKALSLLGKTPYIAETALRKLYTDKDASQNEIEVYLRNLCLQQDECYESVSLQSKTEEKDETIDAGNDGKKVISKKNTQVAGEASKGKESASGEKDKDVNAGSKGSGVPRLQKITKKMNLPLVKGKIILDLEHLIEYKPDQTKLFNTRATDAQFAAWYEGVKAEYELSDDQMGVVMNGFMVWCIDNGTSPDINGVWVMMDGDEQVEYPLKPMVENAKPTLRQIMHHFSDAAEAYIEMRCASGPYMPRYGLLRNLRDKNLARYAFDFYEVNAKTSDRAREAVAQMKAAALSNVTNKLFGLDGNVATTSEDTERHTARDVNRNMHTLLGMGSPQ
uniref:Genome polyprotein n=2 Tax=Passion fruit woodiness virus TaxID=31732 RepID=M5AN52_9POTV|nr:polyprotein [Passion fruit woodiness virus]